MSECNICNDYETRYEKLLETHAVALARIEELESFILRNSDPFDMTEPETAIFHEIGKRLVPQNY